MRSMLLLSVLFVLIPGHIRSAPAPSEAASEWPLRDVSAAPRRPAFHRVGDRWNGILLVPDEPMTPDATCRPWSSRNPGPVVAWNWSPCFYGERLHTLWSPL